MLTKIRTKQQKASDIEYLDDNLTVLTDLNNNIIKQLYNKRQENIKEKLFN